MAIITTGNSFNATDAVTSTKLNNIANAATFVAGAVDGTSLELKSDGKLGVKDDGITLSKVNANAIGTSQLVDNAVTTAKIIDNAVTTAKIVNNAVTTDKILNEAVTTAKIDDSSVTTAKLATSSSKTTGVTFAKMQHISTDKILGRTSSSEGDVEEINFLDQDDMSSNSNTSVATQQSIKAYVDASSTDGFTPTTVSSGQKSVTLPNGLIMKFGTATSTSDSPQVFTFTNIGHTAFPNECINLTTGGMPNHYVTSLSTTSFVIDRYDAISGSFTFYWQAIGR